MVGDVTFCSSFLQAYNTLDLKLPRYVLSTCQDPSILDSATLDKALAGSYITTTTQSSKSDLATYAGIIKKYDPKASPNPSVSSNQADGVTPVLTLAAIMKGSTQPVTAAGIKTQTETATERGHPALGRPDLHLQRDGHPAPQVGVLVFGGDRRHPEPASPARSPRSRCTTRRRCSRRRVLGAGTAAPAGSRHRGGASLGGPPLWRLFGGPPLWRVTGHNVDLARHRAR